MTPSGESVRISIAEIVHNLNTPIFGIQGQTMLTCIREVSEANQGDCHDDY